jgi:hypothetical protein
MNSRLIIQRTLEYSHENMHYLSEVLTTQFDDEVPTVIFSVEIVPDSEGLLCTIYHHTKHGKVYHRECRYADLKGPYTKGKNEAATLIPEFRYLMHLYKEDSWLYGDEMGSYFYGSQESNRRHEHMVALQKHMPLLEDRALLDVSNSAIRRVMLLDMLRDWNFEFELKRLRLGIVRPENIFASHLPPDVERYIICTNYAQQNGKLNNAAGITVLLDLLRLNRSDLIAKTEHFTPPALEIIFLDGEKGDEGARSYLWQLREAQRKQILGVINLELWGAGEQLVASRPQPIGNGKLLASLFYAAKQENRHLVKKLPSPLNPVFEQYDIPFMTICNLHPEEIQPMVVRASQEDTANTTMPVSENEATSSEATLQNAVNFLRDIVRMLAYVKGDEAQAIPDVSYAQSIENTGLIKLNKNEA